MKTICCRLLLLLLSSAAASWGQRYTNFVRQIQYPSGVAWDATVAASGQQVSQLGIDPGGARFELWTVQSSPLANYLLASQYVSTYIPIAHLMLATTDPSSTLEMNRAARDAKTPLTARTRADQPFTLYTTISGLRAGIGDPDASKKVKFLRYMQSYGPGGTGIGIDRTQATLYSQTYLNQNCTESARTYAITVIPATPRTKVRGEERFVIFSLPDYQAPASQLASATVQIWPVADGAISGMTSYLKYAAPPLTITLNDLYPDSTTYAQVYKGNESLGTVGKVVPGSAVVVYDSVPQNRVLRVDSYIDVFDSDGRWTMELVTKTPFGLDRLYHVSFDVKRSMQVRGGTTTVE